MRVLGVRSRWRSLITEHDLPHRFRDVEVIGVYRLWDHRHRFWPENGGPVIEDVVVYEPPLGPIGALMNRLLVHRQLRDIFEYRRCRIEELLRGGVTRSGSEAGAQRRRAESRPG